MTRAVRESLIRQTIAGAVRGARDGEVLSWKGIPFAASPTGERRFRRPQPPEPWHELRDATAFGAMAPQHVLKSMEVDPSVPLGEDCLTLNVWAPAGSAPGAAGAAGRPVMVWIHGGGYFAGSTAQRFYDATTLAAEGDVVVVTVNYRLGILGFVDFSSLNPGTDSAFRHGFDANVGLRDQIAGLAWVQRNIAAFGGDPGNVTLFGESAGGASVIALMASPLTTGLFHRAIAQSAPVTSVYGRERAATVAHRFLDIVGIDPGDAHRLRELDPFDLVDAGAELVHEVSGAVPGTLAMAPVIDDEVVPEYPLTAFREGHVPRIPLIIGTNHDESSFFKLMRSPLLPITSEKVEQMFAEIAADNPGSPGFDEAGARITGAYPSYPRRRTPAEVSRDAGFRMPSIWLAEAHSRHAPTWMYRFDHATPLLRVTGIGATHAAELAYVFGSFAPRGRDIVFGLGGRAEALRVAGRMRGRWIAFARGEAPDTDAVPWPPYDTEERPTLIIDREERVDNDPDGEIREAWGPEILAFR
ncbi:carboxylesterase/lipase family protein [Herbiconiux flava]|uniref:Carboxylic ester hydrolase n=1 Tax=Herbiconiux flava TaxID=881268 RepID=A0A852SC44_9MICO|nr:carboxylesterase/lipase family protein [Herbiconiux flava]NYD69982.1 para-nitrobenzyl esterase [Herbiconiux flava]GLK16732.1 carboxylic ester hydrolase [Herbiconiux flava]